MKKIYICPELDIYETEIDGLMTDLWSRTQGNRQSDNGDGVTVSGPSGSGEITTGGEFVGSSKGGFHSYGGFLEDDFEDEY